MARNAELEAAIIKSPTDWAAYQVYSDWLMEQGDPRGELISLQRMQKKKEWEARLKEHPKELLGPLVHEDLISDVEWHMGFIKSCTVRSTHDRENSPRKYDGYNGSEAIEELLAHPSAMFLRDFTIGILAYSDNSYGHVFEMLAKNPKPLLNQLYVGAFESEETELNWSSIGTTAPLWREGVVPNLEQLTLRSGSMDLEGIHAPNMKSLHLITGGFDSKSLEALCAASWPNLHTLELQLGQEHEIAIDELDAIFEGSHFPALKSLTLSNTMISDEIAAAIVESKIVKQLESLDLTLGTLGDEGAEALIRGKSALAHLKRIDLSENWISKSVCSRLNGICAQLFDAAQQDDQGDRGNRYIAAYE
jgi:uncharacterized protein (TIGR02996 family)